MVFVTFMGLPVATYSTEKQLNIIKKEMNVVEEIKAKKDRREPKILEKINPYIIRHIFTTRCFENGMDSKVV